MRSLVRMDGNFDTTVIDESRFRELNLASAISELTVGGLGSAGAGQFFASVDIRDGAISKVGSTDQSLVFEKTLTVNSSGIASTFLQLQLMTTLRLLNGFIGPLGVGSGVLGADFMGTAGVVSIDLFNSLGQRMDYTFTSDDGDFAFLAGKPIVTEVPEPSSGALMLLGLCAVAGFEHRRRRRNQAAA
jgi:hypothetical protein